MWGNKGLRSPHHTTFFSSTFTASRRIQRPDLNLGIWQWNCATGLLCHSDSKLTELLIRKVSECNCHQFNDGITRLSGRQLVQKSRNGWYSNSSPVEETITQWMSQPLLKRKKDPQSRRDYRGKIVLKSTRILNKTNEARYGIWWNHSRIWIRLPHCTWPTTKERWDGSLLDKISDSNLRRKYFYQCAKGKRLIVHSKIMIIQSAWTVSWKYSTDDDRADPLNKITGWVWKEKNYFFPLLFVSMPFWHL